MGMVMGTTMDMDMVTGAKMKMTITKKKVYSKNYLTK